VPWLAGTLLALSFGRKVLSVEHSDILRQRGIVYTPDFVMNAGGLLNIAAERASGGYNETHLYAQVRNGDALARITV
jgi:leucine dehydrogenase